MRNKNSLEHFVGTKLECVQFDKDLGVVVHEGSLRGHGNLVYKFMWNIPHAAPFFPFTVQKFIPLHTELCPIL